jgi:hypothetical protein
MKELKNATTLLNNENSFQIIVILIYFISSAIKIILFINLSIFIIKISVVLITIYFRAR